MLIIPIDNFSIRKGVQANPTPCILLTRKGIITLNSKAVTALDVKDQKYLHFYEDGPNVYIKVDADPVHGLKLRYNPEKMKCVTAGVNAVKYLAEKMQIDEEAVKFTCKLDDADFGKFLITPIITVS